MNGQPLPKLRAYVQEMVELESAVALAHWDQRTHMPPLGDQARAPVVARLTRLAFDRLVAPAFGDLLQEAETHHADLTEHDRSLIAHWRREHNRKRAIPPDLFQRHVAACVTAQSAWEKAKEASDFRTFQPRLEEVVTLTQEIAHEIGYTESPYDALLEEYEPGTTTSKLRALIGPLVDALTPLVRECAGSAEPSRLPPGPFSFDTQRALSRTALTSIGYDFSAGRLDDAAHPFTIGIGPKDIRVTNRYKKGDVLSGLFGALHEGGHALYEQSMPEELSWTGLNTAASFGIHESQSRLWENQIGRSAAFWSYFHPHLVQHLPAFATTSPEDLVWASTRVAPSLVRTDADEVTYNLHIAIRFEIEVDLIEGKIAVSDLPELWSNAYRRYLDIEPTRDAEGVLQDVHWSGGMFGYFPSYLLGNLYAAQLMKAVERDIPNLWDYVRQGELARILRWLNEHVHRYGATYRPEALIEKATGSPPSTEPFIAHLNQRYREG